MRKALFLDRDGVINVDRDYVHRIEDFVWQAGIFDLARAAAGQGFALVVVTNQSGIGRGYYSEADYEALSQFMRARFAAEGAPISAAYHCPFHPEAVRPEYRAADHPWRKPQPGMILAARDDLGLDLGRSILVGDRPSDIEAGRRAGVGTLVLVGDGARAGETTGSGPHLLLPSVAEAARWLTVRAAPA